MNYIEYRMKLKKLGLQTVDDFLDNVDYSEGFIKGYQPSEFAVKYLSFCSLLNQSRGLETDPTPISHFVMLDSLVYGGKGVTSLCSRGQGKTSLIPMKMPWYMAVFGSIPRIPKLNFMLYISDTVDNGVKTLKRDLQDAYDETPLLQELVPYYNGTEMEHMFKNSSGKKSYLNCFGILGGVRGQQRQGKRPQLIILDDVMSDKTGDSEAAIEKMNDVIYAGLLPALDPKVGKIYFQGTPFSAKDPIYSAIESGAWDVNVFPIAEQFPCAPEDFRGAWPERFTYEGLKSTFELAIDSGRGKATQREMMLRLVSDVDKLVPENELVWYSRQDVVNHIDDFNILITTDFAVSEKKKADPSVVCVWAVDWQGNYYLLDGIHKRQTMDLNFDSLFHMVQVYSPYSTGIEVTGQQKGFIKLIQKEMITRKVHFTLARDPSTHEFGIRPITQKYKRFTQFALPLLKQGKIRLPEELKDNPLVLNMVKEITSVTDEGIRSKTDDCLDNLSMLGVMPSALPSKPSTLGFTTVDNIHNQDYDEDIGIARYTV